MFDHLPMKLVSLGLAALLWLVIAGEKTSEMGVAAHVELQNFPRDLEVTGEPVNAVEVRLRASPGIIQRIEPGEVSAQLDLTGLREGEHIVHLTEDNIRLPFGVKVVKISPASITINLERTLQKAVPIRPRILGRPHAGFEVAELVSEPPEVRISGPKSRVQEVESAFTEAVSVEGVRATVVEHVNIGLEDRLLRIQGSPRVKVTAKIQEDQRKRTFEDLPIQPRRGAATLRPARARVVMTGPASMLAALKPEDVQVFVDLQTITAEGEVTVSVDLAPGSPGLSVFELDPDRVTVQVSRPRRNR